MITDPPARNAMWRYGYTNPVNYNDNELYCGGFSVQWNQNEGKCGVCGDNFADAKPRPHEAGGRYGNGIIGRRYTMGQTIDIEIDISANPWGQCANGTEGMGCGYQEIFRNCADVQINS